MRFHLGFLFLALSIPGSAALAADEPPRRKSGLWRIEQTISGKPSPMGVIETCIDEKTDDLMRERASEHEQKCEKAGFTREGDAFRVHSVCKLEHSVATMDGKFTGSFDSAYRSEMHISYAPPMHGVGSADMVMDAKWLGPCKPGQKAGDIVMPGFSGKLGGGQMNMQDLMKMRDAMKKRGAPAE
ncbi:MULTISPECIES: DUF3617 domain-containing protein [Methylosinus]|uniref:DUF3617 domain-containing protein n=1 Tax=Methylosinus trichosporium (strain ATCC 35070 / NCIMB 11131 / UNIQEM 75 / OB3b) TaxID=595536 RepID=A0A2D2D0R3_METT3|nr:MULTISPECIES: DUF3617 family protein [Methylosinus]ATQ68570.1 DUF3617 domain-containing protein [Methylosinus trichosporium OB3b]OBS52776.1 hypothetical protein A8B73_09220 [Methylosinus sp. 3S-1]